MANADSPTNMLWLINQATAGELTQPGTTAAASDVTSTQQVLSRTSPGMDFTNIKIDVTANG
jgi:hypothetical protein